MSTCPCGSSLEYLACCGLYHTTEKRAPTPEALMRSRYTAFALANIDYIEKTMRDKALVAFNADDAEAWAREVFWIGLDVIEASSIDGDQGFVEFIARFMHGNQLQGIHEKSEFHRHDNAWFYVDGIRYDVPNERIQRNTACPCGNGKKFKRCHGK